MLGGSTTIDGILPGGDTVAPGTIGLGPELTAQDGMPVVYEISTTANGVTLPVETLTIRVLYGGTLKGGTVDVAGLGMTFKPASTTELFGGVGQSDTLQDVTVTDAPGFDPTAVTFAGATTVYASTAASAPAR